MAAKTSLIVLAAGQSARMGRPKQLLPLGDISLLNYCLRTAVKTSVGKVVVVLGAQVEPIQSQLEDNSVIPVVHSDWAAGMGGSLAAGLRYVLQVRPELDQVLISLGDLPLMDETHFQKLLETADDRPEGIIATQYESTQGVPVLFKRPYFEKLLGLQGEGGAKGLLAKHSDDVCWVTSDKPYVDVDTPEDYQRILRILDLS